MWFLCYLGRKRVWDLFVPQRTKLGISYFSMTGAALKETGGYKQHKDLQNSKDRYSSILGGMLNVHLIFTHKIYVVQHKRSIFEVL